MDEIRHETLIFQGGRLAQYYDKWEQLTTDPEILEIVQGVTLQFDCEEGQVEQVHTVQPTLSAKERKVIDKEIDKLRTKERKVIDKEIDQLSQKGVISKCPPQAHQFVSPVFVRPKKDGTHRMILNLKKLNEDITYHHFKMETLQAALKVVTPGCFMASIDLKDAYYTVPVEKEHRKFLRLEWEGQL